MILNDRDSFSLSLSGFKDGFVSTIHIFDVCIKFKRSLTGPEKVCLKDDVDEPGDENSRPALTLSLSLLFSFSLALNLHSSPSPFL